MQWTINHFINWWRLKIYEMHRLVQNSNENTITSITCWSTDDVWKRPKCWKRYHTLLQFNNFHELMTSKNIRNVPDGTNSNENATVLITCWSTDDVWKCSKLWNCIITNEKAIIFINWWRLKTSETRQMLQIAMKMQSFWSPVDHLMTSENVPNVGNGTAVSCQRCSTGVCPGWSATFDG